MTDACRLFSSDIKTAIKIEQQPFEKIPYQFINTQSSTKYC